MWYCPFGLCQVHLLDAFWWPKVFADTRSLKVANSRDWVPSHLCHHSWRVHRCLVSFYQHPCPLLHSSLLAQQEYPSAVYGVWHSAAGHIILLFHCNHSLTLGRTLLLLWCWKGLPSWGWWWAVGDWSTSHDSVHDVLANKKFNAMLAFILFSTEENLVFFFCSCFATFLHLISQSARMFYLYLSISCDSSWSLPAALSVLVFQVPMVMLSLPRIFDDAPVAYLTPPISRQFAMKFGRQENGRPHEPSP